MDMNNQDAELSFQGAGQTPKPSEDGATPAQDPQVQGKESDGSKLFSSPEAEAAFIQKIKEGIMPDVQSFVDKANAAAKRQVDAAVASVQEQVKAIRDGGQEVSPELEQALIDQAKKRAQSQTQPAKPSDDQDPGQGPAEGGQAVDVDAGIAELKALVGDEFMIHGSDPEVQAFGLANQVDTPEGRKIWLTNLKAAMLAKRARVRSANPNRAIGGLTTGQGQSPLSTTTNPQELFRMAFDED